MRDTAPMPALVTAVSDRSSAHICVSGPSAARPLRGRHVT